MKRIFFSIISSAFVIFFYVMTIVIIQIVFNISDEKILPFSYFLRLPSYIFYEVLNLTEDNVSLVDGIILVTTAFLFNVVMYSPIFYLLSLLLPKRKSKIEVSEFPPDPPQFC